MHALAGVAATLGGPAGLGAYLYLGRGEDLTGGRTKPSILADATEALIGAVYLEHGLEPAREVVHRLFASLLRNAPLLGAGLDWKTSLQELTAASDLGVPEYRIAEEGPDHLKMFTATAVVAGRDLGSGVGRTKKEAEQKAAELAWHALTKEAATSSAAERLNVPELPEVEVVRRGLAEHVRKRTIVDVAVAPPARGAPPPRRRRRFRRPPGGPHDHRGASPRQVPVAGARRRRATTPCSPTSA